MSFPKAQFGLHARESSPEDGGSGWRQERSLPPSLIRKRDVAYSDSCRRDTPKAPHFSGSAGAIGRRAFQTSILNPARGGRIAVRVSIARLLAWEGAP